MPLLAAFVFGTIAGSFFNVCIFRIPEGRSVVFPRSACRSCSRPIAWYDNVPCLSYLWLKGRCRACGARVSVQYPIIEAATGLLFVAHALRFGWTPYAAVTLVLSSVLLLQGVIDWKHRIIPDALTLPGIAAGLAASCALPQLQGETGTLAALGSSALGLLAGGGFLYAAGWLGERVFRKEAMGGGDVKLMALVGAWTGPVGVLWTVLVGSLAGSVYGLYRRWKNAEEHIPFGPFLGAGAFLYVFFGERVIAWYLYYVGRGL